MEVMNYLTLHIKREIKTGKFPKYWIRNFGILEPIVPTALKKMDNHDEKDRQSIRRFLGNQGAVLHSVEGRKSEHETPEGESPRDGDI